MDRHIKYDKAKILAQYIFLEVDSQLSGNGNPDDFSVFPSLREAMSGFQVTVLKALLDTKRRIYKIPFLRETQSQLNLVAVFSFGKIYFRINRTAPIVEYLNAHNI